MSTKSTALCAYGAAAILFTLYIVFPRGSPAPAYRVPEMAAYLFLFPVVAALPAAAWARAAAYGWLVINIVTGATALHNPEGGGELLRLGGSLVEALWVASASLAGRGALAAVGLPLTLLLAATALAAPRLPPPVFLLLFLLLLLWLVLAGRTLHAGR